jgi:glycerol kinase
MGCVLAIDQGTSGTKAVVVDHDGTIVSLAEVALSPSYLDGGGVEIDPELLWRSVVEAGHKALEGAGRSIVAVALANQGETVLAWNRTTGRPLSPAIVWQDTRAQSVCESRRDAADRVREVTGLVLDPYFSAPKMRWLRDHVTRDGVVTTTDAWLVNRLCGAFVTDASTASRSLIYDLDANCWSDELLDVFGLGGEDLPDIVDCDSVVGVTSVFGRPVPLAGVVVDQQAALLAQRCLDPGTAKCTYGTGAFLLAQLGASPLRSSADLTTSVAWRVREAASYCVDGQVYTAAAAVSWIVGLGLVASADEMDSVARPDSEGVLCVPSLAGLAAPWWDAHATASVTGMTLSTEAGHLVRAVLEGIAAQVAVLAALVAADLGAPMSRLRVDGGLTRSRVLMQAQADIAQIPVDVYPSAHATPLGAAACARLAADPDLSLEAAVIDWVPEHTYEPAWSPDRAQDFLHRWHIAASHQTTTGHR